MNYSVDRRIFDRTRTRLIIVSFFVTIIPLITLFWWGNFNLESKNLQSFQSWSHENGHDLSKAVVMGTLAYDRLRLIGGTGHWFHLLERLLPVIPKLALEVWTQRTKNTELYIVFQEEYGAKELDSFATFLLVSIVSGGLFDKVIIGHASSVQSTGLKAHDHPIVLAKRFVPSISLSLDRTRGEKFTTLKLSTNASSDRSFAEIAHVSWEFVAKKKYNMVNRRVWALFQEAVNRTCPAIFPQSSYAESRSLISAPSTISHDHLSNPPMRIAKRIKKWHNGSYFSPPRIVHLANPTVLIYQRDVSRRIINAEHTAHVLQQKLNTGITNNHTWTVELLTHRNQRHPCDLLSSVRRSTVLVTPHGFQSILLLFQPVHSLLVELHPSLYYKPEVFGLVQAGIREHLKVERYYISSQSKLKSWYMKLISAVMSWFPLRDAGYCTGNSLCRYLARLQEVEVDEAFIEHISRFCRNVFQISV